MNSVETIFRNRSIKVEKATAYGFIRDGENYLYSKEIGDGQFVLTVKISPEGRVSTDVIDRSTHEKYTLFLVPDAGGPFITSVRNDYEAILSGISQSCSEREVFKSKQAKEIIDYAQEHYHCDLEYLWDRLPEAAILRRHDNRKWYAVLLRLSRRKLGFDCDDLADILDVRVVSDDMAYLLDGKQYLPGYHMNKKHWITICLDDSVATEDILYRIDESYNIAGNKK